MQTVDCSSKHVASVAPSDATKEDAGFFLAPYLDNLVALGAKQGRLEIKIAVHGWAVANAGDLTAAQMRSLFAAAGIDIATGA